MTWIVVPGRNRPRLQRWRHPGRWPHRKRRVRAWCNCRGEIAKRQIDIGLILSSIFINFPGSHLFMWLALADWNQANRCYNLPGTNRGPIPSRCQPFPGRRKDWHPGSCPPHWRRPCQQSLADTWRADHHHVMAETPLHSLYPCFLFTIKPI